MRNIKVLLAFVLTASLIFAVTQVRATGTGTIDYLTASGDNPVTIATQLRIVGNPGDKVNNSNMRFYLYDAGNTLLETHGPVLVPTLEIGGQETFTYNFQWSPPAIANYSVEACWSPGNSSSNCSINQANTVFSGVDTLGNALWAVAVGLIGIWFGAFAWNHRRSQRARAT